MFRGRLNITIASSGGVEVQLDVVQHYCEGSVAKLNLFKSTLLPLNRHQICEPFALVQVLSRSDSVKYLGFLLVDHQWVIR